MVKKKLSAEETDGRVYEDDQGVRTADIVAGVYKVVVRATDPSGEGENENRDDIVVTITATNVNEAPGVRGMAELSVNEANSSLKDSNVTKYVGLGYELTDTDPQVKRLSSDNPDNPTSPNLYLRSEEDILDRAIWPDDPIGGPDGHLFEYSTPGNGIGRRVHFIAAPDYEDPMDANRDNVYEVTIGVVDSKGLTGEKTVRVTVMNVDEAGKLVLSPDQPDDGMPVIATLTDPDGVVSITNWEWAAIDSKVETYELAAATDGTINVVAVATSDEHTGEVGDFLWAMVEYRDGASVMDDPVTDADERNDDPDTEQDAETNFDSDEMEEAGTDNAVRTDPDPDNGVGGPSADVVNVTLTVRENTPSTGYVGDPLEGLSYKDATGAEQFRDTIGGPDADSFVFAEGQDGTDSMYYDAVLQGPGDNTVDPPVPDVDDKQGQLALVPVTHLDYESAKKFYTIEITDPNAQVAIGAVRVTIMVEDVNEAPSAPSELRGPPPVLNVAPEFAAATDIREVAENTAAGMNIGAAVTATDADDDDVLTYELGGADAGSFDIDAATGQLMTMAALDFETQASYTVEVTTDDGNGGTATVTVTITVTDVNEDTALARYDTDNDGSISRPELVAAIRDLLFPADPANPAVTRAEVLDLIRTPPVR